jgi:hypothetical protein
MIRAFAVDGIRRSDDELAYGGAPFDYLFEKDGGAIFICADVSLNFIHRLRDAYFCGLMIDDLDAFQSALNRFAITNIAVNELGIRVQIIRRCVSVNLRNERIEYSHAVASRNESVDQVRSDESGSARHKNVQSAFSSVVAQARELAMSRILIP